MAGPTAVLLAMVACSLALGAAAQQASCSLDICYAIDRSSSITSNCGTCWGNVQSFVNGITDAVFTQPGGSGARFGAARYGKRAAYVTAAPTSSSASGLVSRTDLKNAVTALQPPGTGETDGSTQYTNMEAGLAMCFTPSGDAQGMTSTGTTIFNAWNQNAQRKRVIIHITDGLPNKRYDASPKPRSCATGVWAGGACPNADTSPGGTGTRTCRSSVGDACVSDTAKWRADDIKAAAGPAIALIGVGVAGASETYMKTISDTYFPIAQFNQLANYLDALAVTACCTRVATFSGPGGECYAPAPGPKTLSYSLTSACDLRAGSNIKFTLAPTPSAANPILAASCVAAPSLPATCVISGDSATCTWATAVPVGASQVSVSCTLSVDDDSLTAFTATAELTVPVQPGGSPAPAPINIAGAMLGSAAATTLTSAFTSPSCSAGQSLNLASCTCQTAPDVAASAVSPPAAVELGQTAPVQLVVSNVGPVTATAVTLTSTLPSGLGVVGPPACSLAGCTCVLQGLLLSCSVGSLAPGASATVSLTTQPTAVGTYTVPVTVGCANEVNLANNNAQATVEATSTQGGGGIADAMVALFQQPAVLIDAGTDATLAFEVDTDSTLTGDLEGFSVSLDIPAGLDVSAVTCVNQACACSSTTARPITCSLDPSSTALPPSMAPFYISLTVTSATVGQALSVEATISGTNDDDPSNNVATASVTFRCAPGTYQDLATDTTCTDCGLDNSCDGGDTRPKPCPPWLGTTSTTGKACKVLTCNACPSAAPDVLLTTGSGSRPARALWLVKAFSASTTVAPRYLCKLNGFGGSMVGDAAITYRGDVFITDVLGNVRLMRATDFHAAALKPAGDALTAPVSCNTVPVATLPPGFGAYTGLTMGAASNLLWASTHSGKIIKITLSTAADGTSADVTASLHAERACDAAAAAASLQRDDSGGTDVSMGPDGMLYRFCSDDGTANNLYSSTAFDPVNSATAYHTNYGIPQGAAVYGNAGSFCTSTAVIGTGTLSSDGTLSAYWAHGTTNGAPPGTPVADLPVCASHGHTVTSATPNLLRTNGAANQPTCDGRLSEHGTAT